VARGARGRDCPRVAATVALIDVYPQALRWRLLALAFETMIEGGQVAATRLLARQRDDDPTLSLTRGMLRGADGDTDGALAIYDAFAAGKDRLLHARAAVRAVERGTHRQGSCGGRAGPAILRQAWR
jgi:hypothetical protein